MVSISRRTRIEQLFHSALQLGGGERARLFSTIPPDDVAIVSEVESLLLAYESNPSLLDEPAVDLTLSVINHEEEEIPAGSVIGAYRIDKLVGRGGMGNVYLAMDQTLDRRVALKFLSNSLTGDPWARKQLVREARAVAALSHPNICPVYGYEEVGEHRFIVMEYVNGRSLAELIRDHAVDQSQVFRYAVEISDAMSEAHNRGIIHRDIKPGNIMVTIDGHIKILDFGLAKYLPSPDARERDRDSRRSNTRPGLVMGTVAYMSPEQLKTEKLDLRSDIFSIGTVLFEIASGHHPFERKSDAETISAILNARASVDNASYTRMPAGLAPVVRKCLEPKKEERYRSANELLVELQETKRRPRAFRRAPWRFAALAFVGVLLISVAYLLFAKSSRPRSMAVIPYQNLSGDQAVDYLADGIYDSLSIKLASSGSLRLRPVPPSIPQNVDALAFGRQNGVDLVLTGSLGKQQDHLLLTTNLLDVKEGVTTRTWTLPFQAGELPDLEQRMADELFSGLALPKDVTNGKAMRRGTVTESGEAARQYVIGRYYWKRRDKDNIKLAIDAFQKSIEADPGYAPPHAGLADSYVLLNLSAYGTVSTREAMTKARAAAREALEIDPGNAEAHSALGVVLMKYDWNWHQANLEFQEAIASEPDYAAAHYWYSNLLANLGRFDEAIREATTARDLDPFSPQGTMNLARNYYYARRYDEALDLLSGASRSDKKSQYILGLILLQKGRFDEARKLFEDISAGDPTFAAAPLGYAYAKLGRPEETRRLIAELNAESEKDYVPPIEFVVPYIGLGDNKMALEYLNKCLAERHATLIAIKVEPLFDPLRNEPRFESILQDMALDSD